MFVNNFACMRLHESIYKIKTCSARDVDCDIFHCYQLISGKENKCVRYFRIKEEDVGRNLEFS